MHTSYDLSRSLSEIQELVFSLCRSVFLPRTLSLLPVLFRPPLWAQMPHAPGSHKRLLCVLLSCQTLVLSWQWWSLFDLGGQPLCLLCLHTTFQHNKCVDTLSLCEVKVKNYRTELHNDSCHCVVVFIENQQLHESFSCTFCFPAALRFTFSKSWESSQWDSTDKQQMLKCLLWLMLDLCYCLPFFIYFSSFTVCSVFPLDFVFKAEYDVMSQRGAVIYRTALLRARRQRHLHCVSICLCFCKNTPVLT